MKAKDNKHRGVSGGEMRLMKNLIPYSFYPYWLLEFDSFASCGNNEIAPIIRATLNWDSIAEDFICDLRGWELEGLNYPEIEFEFIELTRLLIHWCQQQLEFRLNPDSLRDFLITIQLFEQSKKGSQGMNDLVEKAALASEFLNEVRTAYQCKMYNKLKAAEISVLSDCEGLAFQQYEEMEQKYGKMLDRQAYDLAIETMGQEGPKVKFETWSRYLSRARRKLKKSKYVTSSFM